MVIAVVAVQLFVSVAVIVYEPAVIVKVPPLMLYVFAPVPPIELGMMVVVPPKHTIGDADAVTTTGSVAGRVKVADAKQLLSSSTVTE